MDEIATQLDLVDLSALPERQDLVELVKVRPLALGDGVKRKVFGHNGRLLLKKLRDNEELATAICLSLRAGMHARLVARRYGISPRSIVAIREAMTEKGDLAPVRVRCDRLLDQFVEVTFERVIEGTLNGEIHPGQLSIAALAGADKKAQRDAGLVQGTERTAAEVTVETVRAQFALLRAAAEMESGGNGSNGPVIEAETVIDTLVATPGAVVEPGGAGGAAIGAGDGGAAGDEGGGGDRAAAEPAETDEIGRAHV